MQHIKKISLVFLFTGTALYTYFASAADTKKPEDPTIVHTSNNLKVGIFGDFENKTDAAMTFKILPNDGNVINYDESTFWQINIKSAKGIKFAKDKLERADFSRDIPGFKMKLADKPEKDWQFTYRLVAFVCTKSKDRCFRDDLKDKIVTVTDFKSKK